MALHDVQMGLVTGSRWSGSDCSPLGLISLRPRRDRWAGDHSDHPSQSAAGKITIGKKRRFMQDTVMQSLPIDDERPPTYTCGVLRLIDFFSESSGTATKGPSILCIHLYLSLFLFLFPLSNSRFLSLFLSFGVWCLSPPPRLLRPSG